jgi:hypothetical protein
MAIASWSGCKGLPTEAETINDTMRAETSIVPFKCIIPVDHVQIQKSMSCFVNGVVKGCCRMTKIKHRPFVNGVVEIHSRICSEQINRSINRLCQGTANYEQFLAKAWFCCASE